MVGRRDSGESSTACAGARAADPVSRWPARLRIGGASCLDVGNVLGTNGRRRPDLTGHSRIQQKAPDHIYAGQRASRTSQAGCPRQDSNLRSRLRRASRSFSGFANSNVDNITTINGSRWSHASTAFRAPRHAPPDGHCPTVRNGSCAGGILMLRMMGGTPDDAERGHSHHA